MVREGGGGGIKTGKERNVLPSLLHKVETATAGPEEGGSCLGLIVRLTADSSGFLVGGFRCSR